MNGDYDRRLADLVRPYIERLNGQRVIDAREIADLALADLDPPKCQACATAEHGRIVLQHYPDVHFAAHCALCQSARGVLRRLYPLGDGTETEHRAKDKAQLSLDPQYDRLQRRYPQAHDKSNPDPGYVLREEMTEADWRWNLAQLDKVIFGLQQHRVQLKKWGMVRGWADPDAASEPDQTEG